MSLYRSHQKEFKEPGYLKSPGDNETTAKSMSLDSRFRGNDGVLSASSLSFPRSLSLTSIMEREAGNRLHGLIAVNRIRDLSGFTLFELLVVVLIISLISAFVMPRVAASLPGVRLKSATRAVASALRYARSRAVYESRPYIAVFDNTRKFLAVEAVDNPIDAAELNRIREILNASELEKVYQFPDGIEFDVSSENDPYEDADEFAIFFFPRGDSTGAKIVLKNLRRKQYTITVDTITGSVEIES